MSVAALEYRQTTLSSLLGVVEALRSLAAAKQQRAQSLMPDAGRFAEAAARGMAAFDPAEAPGRAVPTLHLLIGPEQGFTGGLAGRVVEALPAGVRDPLIIGSRTVSAAQARGIDAKRWLPSPGQVNALADLAAALTRQLPEDQTVTITHAAATGPAHAHLPPLPRQARQPGCLIQLPPAAVLAGAARLDRLARLTAILLDAYLAEQLARLSTLTGARERIRERLEQLSTQLTGARQDAISQEIADLWAGRSALATKAG
jgi:hypothetical protein